MNQPTHAELYVLKRIERVLPRESIEKDNGYDSSKFYFTCYPSILHRFYENGEVSTLQIHQEHMNEVEVECFSPTNIIHDENKTLICYNPQAVLIGNKDCDVKSKIVICHGFVIRGELQFKRDVKAWDGKDINYYPSPDCRKGKIEIEIYSNLSPCDTVIASSI